MGKYLRSVVQFCLLLIMTACGQHSDLLRRMERIKRIGNTDTETALLMLDSLETQIRDMPKHIQMKYDLLGLRLHDKADDTPNSDIVAKNVVKFFEENGDDLEKQEACYYAGSVYRDLKDTPRALEYFYKSTDVANAGKECDSLMLRNAYSQISYLLWSVQDYPKANYYAKKEYEIGRQIKTETINALIHLGVTYNQIDSVEQAKTYFDKVLDKIMANDSTVDDNTIYLLITNYSLLGDYSQAKKCYLLSQQRNNHNAHKNYQSLATYFELTNQIDSAITYYKQVIDSREDLFNVFDASKSLLDIYYKAGKYKEAAFYANIFREVSDTLDFGRRQELAATVNNQYQYHLDKEKERKLWEERERMRYLIIIISIVAMLVTTTLGLILFYRKNHSLKEKLALTKKLDEIEASKSELQSKIAEREEELGEAQSSLEEVQADLVTLKERLEFVTNEIKEKQKECSDLERQLARQLDMNRTLVNLVNQADLEEKAEEVVQAIRQSAKGKNMTAKEWKQLYHAIDELYPDFYDMLTLNLDKFNEQQMQVCYLMKIGLSNQQIQNMTNLSRVTVWRWTKKYGWIVSSDKKGGK